MKVLNMEPKVVALGEYPNQVFINLERETIIDMLPKEAHDQVETIISYAMNGKIKEVEPLLKRLLKQFPEDLDVRAYVAEAYYLMLHKLKLAQSMLEENLQQNAEHMMSLCVYARLYMAVGQPEKVKELFKNDFRVEKYIGKTLYWQELTNFLYTIALFTCETNQKEKAISHLKLLMGIAAPDYPHLEEIVDLCCGKFDSCFHDELDERKAEYFGDEDEEDDDDDDESAIQN
jgi:tetratricopeptide (TPR) repeat protein